jgi:hypothetical protein
VAITSLPSAVVGAMSATWLFIIAMASGYRKRQQPFYFCPNENQNHTAKLVAG